MPQARFIKRGQQRERCLDDDERSDLEGAVESDADEDAENLKAFDWAEFQNQNFAAINMPLMSLPEVSSGLNLMTDQSSQVKILQRISYIGFR